MGKEYNIAVIPGDGVGPEIVTEALKVLETIAPMASITFRWTHYPFGAEHYLKTKEILPPGIIHELGGFDAILLGAIGDPRVKPGVLEGGMLLNLRFGLDQYINLRPVKLYPNVPTPLRDKGPGDINFYVIRENTEDFYIGIGDRVRGAAGSARLPVDRSNYRAAFNVAFESDVAGDYAYQIGLISRAGAERVIRYGFQLAQRKGLDRVTSVDKANVLSDIYGLWREVFQDVSSEYQSISYEFNYVDAMTMWLVKNPEQFQVVITPNMFGDIITDLGAMIQGGLGLAPGGNINPNGVSMFEPIHGSAPKYKGQGIINPLATILSGQLLLEDLGEDTWADLLERAVVSVLEEGIVRTRDLGGSASTSEMGNAVVNALRRLGEAQG
ncbi:MAG: isocitrate/isopropylmalate dehydrogenase family protein [Bacillota bacterium]